MADRIIVQGQLEMIFIRDLPRHNVLVERSTTLKEWGVSKIQEESHPIRAVIRSDSSRKDEVIRAKFLVRSDGVARPIRK